MRIAGIALLLVLAAPGASGAVLLNVGRIQAQPMPTDQVYPLDVFLSDPDDANGDERLNAFTFGVDLYSGSPGVRFLPTVSVPDDAHPNVFKDFPGGAPQVLSASETRILVRASAGPGQGANVTNVLTGWRACRCSSPPAR
jgi:hypothetical protein